MDDASSDRQGGSAAQRPHPAHADVVTAPVSWPGDRHQEAGNVTAGTGPAGEADGVPSGPGHRQPGRPLIASPALQGLGALVIYLAVWVLAETLPLLLHPGRPQLFQASMDPNFYAWSLRWWPYALTHDLNPLHSTQIAAPGGIDLAWVTSIPPLAVLVSPLTALAGSVVSFSLLVVTAIPLSGWAAFVLCRRLTGRFWPALAGGFVYGFSAYEMNHIFAGQLNLAFAVLPPLMAYLVVLWRDKAIGSAWLVALLGVAMALQFYLFLETFAEMTVLLAIGLVAGYALAGRENRSLVVRLSSRIVMAYVLGVVLAAPFLVYALTHVPPGFVRSPVRTSLDVASMVVPRAGQTFGLPWLNHLAAPLVTPSYDGYIGIPLLLIVIGLAVFAWSSRLVRFAVLMLCVVIIGSLGPELKVDGHVITSLPWARAWFLPIARSAYPVRFMVFGFLLLAVIVALWLAGSSGRAWGRWILALLAGAFIAMNTPALYIQPRPAQPAFITSGQYRHYLTPHSIVVVISERGNAGLLWQAETDFYTRLAGGFVNHALAHGTDLPLPVAKLGRGKLTQGDITGFRTYLARNNISAILVEQSLAGRWPWLLRHAGLHGQAVGGVILFRTAP
jgi:hypothetical protein